ncbi:MAG: hypothetical protein CBE33_01450 [Candidatus Pelagibacter sp. TMED273]|nr:MAG: hypothetical protein CBE33_01450 [Candidatus Pelagibacter sp. TMED273]|tara:strand:+ start:6131 stop:6823 length:693 start_codon:yes stop_codon:yes gene_type:complete
MKDINKVKSISIWIFIVPFVAVNTCLILITQFPGLFPNKEDLILNTIPYIDGGASISRTARVFPTYLIFKPAMFLTSYLLIRYWLLNKEIISTYEKNHKYLKKIVFFGIGSAVCLTLHSIFLGIKFDFEIYKLFRRVIMLSFIVFEVVAQTYLVLSLYSIKEKLSKLINLKILKIKAILVSLLILVAIISIPLVTMPGNKFLKHALEWDYFLAVIFFYFLTFLMWKKNNK